MRALAAVLEARRDAFNARFAAARYANRSLDGAHVLGFLRDTLAPIADAVAELAPDRVADVVERLYDIGLSLVARDLLGPGARRPVLNEGWGQLPSLARPLAEDPDRLARAVSNSLLALDGVGQPTAWMDALVDMARLASRQRERDTLTTFPPHPAFGHLLPPGEGEELKSLPSPGGRRWPTRPAQGADEGEGLSISQNSSGRILPIDVPLLLEAGKVAAWRYGLAQYRLSALALASTLPAPLVGVALGIALADDAARDAALARLRADPWGDPSRPIRTSPVRVVACTDGFRGLGGSFLVPPRVAAIEGRLVATDGERTLALHADRYGAVFVQVTLAFPDLPAKAAPGLLQTLFGGRPSTSWTTQAGPVTWGEDGALRWGSRVGSFPDLAHASSAAFDGQTLAITHPLSHRVFLLAPGDP